eukprot:435078-Alexandrium_andersonii.AAC.1
MPSARLERAPRIALRSSGFALSGPAQQACLGVLPAHRAALPLEVLLPPRELSLLNLASRT